MGRKTFQKLIRVIASISMLVLMGCTGSLAPSSVYQITPYRGIPEPSIGNAVVCVYRIWRFQGGGATLLVFKDGKIVGVSHRGTYFCNETPPGEYSYYLEWGGFFEKITQSTIMRTEAGRQYFISFDDGMREVSKMLAVREMQDLEYIEYTGEKAKDEAAEADKVRGPR